MRTILPDSGADGERAATDEVTARLVKIRIDRD
jgi:hypothetical protein